MSWTSVPCEATLETRAQQDTWAQLQQPEPDAGPGGGPSPKALRWPPGARFAYLAKLLMSGNGYLSHLILLPGPATWALLSCSLKSQNDFWNMAYCSSHSAISRWAMRGHWVTSGKTQSSLALSSQGS